MEKNKVSVSAITIDYYVVAIIVLAAAVFFLGAKYLHLKFAVNEFTQSTMHMNSMQQPTGKFADYGTIIGTTIANYPAGSPLLASQTALQSYIVSISKSLGRNVVVIDTSRKILADTIARNIGSNYAYDTNKEIDATLKDGISRTFVETSSDFPQGLTQTVSPIVDSSNHIVGVILISNTTTQK